MKKWYKLLLLIVLILFVVTACTNKEPSYKLSINEHVTREIYMDEEDVDFKSFFIIRDQDGKVVKVEDSMIDASKVDFTKEGTYKVKLTYKGFVKEVEITIVVRDTISYVITINPGVSTQITMSNTDFDFKQFFTIKDSKENSIEVIDSMIDKSAVDFTKEGSYVVKITYQGVSEQVSVQIINDEPEVTYEIKVNTTLPTTFELGTENVDFKDYFTITDSNGSNVDVLDSMINATAVDFAQQGTYTVTITYQGVSNQITIYVIPGEPEVTYEIKTNGDLPTTFEIGVEVIDFKEYFTITDSNGNVIEVLDSMIDLRNVNLTRVGKFTVVIEYAELVLELEFNIVVAAKMNATDLFISEYAEAKNYDKYIEIFNGTGKTVDLVGYSLMLFNNVEQPAQYSLDLSGSLKDGEILVVYNPSASTTIKNSAGIAHQVISFNGNDAIALYKSEVLIDVVGDLNKPVGNGWDIGNIKEATKDHTIIRKSNVYGPNNAWDPSEWVVLNIEDFSNIKIHAMDNYEPIKEDDGDTPKERVKDLFISEYFEGDLEYKDSKYIEIYNPLLEDVDLNQYSLAVYKNGSKEASFTQPLSGTLKNQELYIVYAPYSSEEIKSVGNLASEVCYFNGKAAIALLKNNEVIDVIGVIGEYPEWEGWLVDDFSTTANNTIIRKEAVNSPTNEWDPSEWYPCYENYLYGLGNHYQVDQGNLVYDNFDLIFSKMKELSLDSKGTATSEEAITVKGTIFMDVKNETTLVYLTDGKNFIKLHGEKIHNFTTPGTVYEIVAYYKAYLYQPTLEVLNPSTDIKALMYETPVTEIEVLEVTLAEVLALNKEDFELNIANGYLQSMLKITGYLQLDTHNSTRYDYALTVGETYTKNNTGYINNGLYFKNDVEELEDFLIDYEVYLGEENVEIDIYGVIYDWNPNRKNWRIYVSDEFTFYGLPA